MTAAAEAPAFLSGGGEVGALMRAHDWSRSPLDGPAGWPQSLRSIVGLMLGSKFPMFVAWGPELGFLYNDSYVPILGDKHPAALGARFDEVWEEVWPDLAPMVEATVAGGSLFHENLPLLINPRGREERATFTFSYSPVRDEGGRVAGLFCTVQETTDRIAAERRVASEGRRFAELFEQAPGFIIAMSGPGHRVDFVNAAHRRLFGSAGWVGREIRDAFPDVAGQGFFELLDHVYATGERHLAEATPARFRLSGTGDPEERRHSFVYEPIRDSRGEVSGVLCQGFDVTDAHRATRLLRGFTEAVPGVVYAKDLDGRMLVANRGVAELVGRPLDRIIGLTDAEFLDSADDAAAVMATDRRIMESGRGEQVEEDIRLADGSPAVWLSTKEPLRDDAGRVVGLVGSSVDVTARRRAEDALREETRTLETLNRVGAALAGELDLERLLQMLTDAGVELTGAQFGAFFHNILDGSGERLYLYTLSGADRADFDKFGNVRATGVFGPTFRNEGVVRSPDILADPRYGRFEPHRGMPPGHLPVRSYMGVPVVSRDGAVLGGLLFGHPEPGRFTERHERLMLGVAAQAAVAIDNARLFAEVQAANETLERRVVERTLELEEAHEALRQSQKMEAVGQLTGGIAHDFNNMLAIVVGSLDLLGRRLPPDDPRARRYLDAAADGARRAAQLTQRLLAFSRQTPLRPEPLDANKLVAGMADLLRHSIGPDIRLDVELDPALWRTHADPNQLENAILNLAVNARDAMPDGGRLAVATRNVADHGGEQVLIAVSDTGLGMTPEVIAKAFDPFFTTKEVGKGTGLGLSQVYGFVNQSGGRVAIRSAPGEGATVEIMLPRHQGAGEEGGASAGDAPLPTARAREVVLVVEDEAAVRQFSTDALSELGYRVLEADGAPAALRLLDAHQDIALLFTDVVMPEVNGARLAEEARRRRPDLRVLFTTGYARDAIAEGGVLEPGVELIGKPFTVEELAAKVRHVLDATAA